ncbi:EKA-like protein [Blumeria hordei DH14]|uniref:EKA-like protein n=1 Tax=Blumeria graminis f. sp. hordei (strain DH14) TaxID=546991 RepID=N1JPD4_BLUG1|nr:EKA-like protein [Blumeria hordei DH14]
MLDAEVEKLKTLAESVWASSSPEVAEQVLDPTGSPRKTVVAPEKRTIIPALPRPAEVSPAKSAETPSTKAAGAENPPLAPQPPALEAAGRKNTYPPKLLAAMEAEERRARQKAAQFTICSTAISSVEAALQPLSIGEDKNFVDSIKVYLRAAIAQFVAAGPNTTPPVLPQRPSVGTPTAPLIQVAIPRNISKATAPLTLRSTWATVTRAGHQRSGTQAPANITFIQGEAKLKQPIHLVSLRIATVSLAVFGLEGRIEVTAEMVAAEILRVTNCTPDRVRIYGKTSPGLHTVPGRPCFPGTLAQSLDSENLTTQE